MTSSAITLLWGRNHSWRALNPTSQVLPISSTEPMRFAKNQHSWKNPFITGPRLTRKQDHLESRAHWEALSSPLSEWEGSDHSRNPLNAAPTREQLFLEVEYGNHTSPCLLRFSFGGEEKKKKKERTPALLKIAEQSSRQFATPRRLGTDSDDNLSWVFRAAMTYIPTDICPGTNVNFLIFLFRIVYTG